MRIRIVTAVVDDRYDDDEVNAEFVRRFIGSGEFIVPGVVGWDNVQTEDLPDKHVRITAELRTIDLIIGGEWSGRRVSVEWVGEYIMGAGEYWLIPGCTVVRECNISMHREWSTSTTA